MLYRSDAPIAVTALTSPNRAPKSSGRRMARRLTLPAITQAFGAARSLALALALPFAWAAPAQAGVVISQVYGGGGNSGSTYKQDFIEIFNNGTSAAGIGGWSVQYASATGTSWSTTPIAAGTLLPAGSYYLIREGSGGANGTIDVVGDATGTLQLSASAGKVALVSSTTALTGAAPSGGALVDLLGFGPTATGFEGAATAALSATTVQAVQASIAQ